MNNLLRVTLIISVLVIVIISAGIFTNHTLNKDSNVMEGHIIEMEAHIRNMDWPKAEEELEHVRTYWLKTQGKWAMLQSHFEINNIDSALTRVSELMKAKEHALTLTEASLLKQHIKQIPEKVAFNLSNIL
jgi:hypothetical protein